VNRRRVENIYDAVSVNYVHQLTKALTAKDLYKRTRTTSCRTASEDRRRVHGARSMVAVVRWSPQAVEAKERVAIKEENHTGPPVTLQNYFAVRKCPA